MREGANVHRYGGKPGGAVTTPVLMVSGAESGLEAWTTLAGRFAGDGFRYLYGRVLAGDDAPPAALAQAVDDVLAEVGAPWLILAAHGEACAHSLHYIESEGGYEKARLFIGLDGRYPVNALSYLEGSLLHRFDEDHPSRTAATLPAAAPPAPPRSMALVNQFVAINLYGQAHTSIFQEGTRPVLPLPEAINVGLHLHPSQIMQSPAVFEHLRGYLRNGFWVVQLHLSSFRMRKAAPDAPVGWFYFEVDGQRVPPDGAFAPPDQSTYTFEHFTPLGTVAIPLTKAAADINFRLREVGRAAGKRRMFTTLHAPLAHGKVSDHVMQDSFGSEIRLRVHCIRAPQVMRTDHDH